MIDDTMLRLYLNGTLDAETSRRVQEELDRDESLRARLEKMRAGEPSFARQQPSDAAQSEQPERPSSHMGATEDQMQGNVEPVALNPVPEKGSVTDLGIDPHDEITPG